MGARRSARKPKYEEATNNVVEFDGINFEDSIKEVQFLTETFQSDLTQDFIEQLQIQYLKTYIIILNCKGVALA